MNVLRLLQRLAPAALSLTLVVPSALASPQAANAQVTPPGSIAGTVVTADGSPVGGVSVTLQGAGASQVTVSDAQGRFGFASVPPAAYSLVLTKAGFATTQQQDVFVASGSATNVSAVLAQSSFSSLRQIGRVATNTAGRATINTTPAAVNVIGAQVFANAGDPQVVAVLNRTPGVVSNPGGNGASRGSIEVTQIRGALPYETESLIDGHAVSVGSDGSFSPTLLNPAMLQDVEIVKGPGSMPTSINYAVGGSVNYRTLEPTRTPRQTLVFGFDGFGGVNTALQATGSIASHKLDYAFAIATDGTPGPSRHDLFGGSSIPFAYGNPPYLINGHEVATAPYGIALGNTPQYAGLGALRLVAPIYTCCTHIDSGYTARNELAKLRYNVSQQTALTVSFLGAQSVYGQDGVQGSSVVPLFGTNSSFVYFDPPAGYAGSVGAGRPIPAALVENLPTRTWQQQNILQGELRTTLGSSDTLLARYYAGYSNDYNIVDSGPNPTYSYTENAWGGVPLCPPGASFDGAAACTTAGGAAVAPTMTFFNGQPVTFTRTAAPSIVYEQNHLRGYSVELDHVAGANTFALAFDRSHHDAVAAGGATPLSAGSSQQFTTISLRAQLALTSKLAAMLSDYAVQYASHYTGDGGLTWHDATHTVNEPRMALTFRPSVDTAVRFAAGGSIAPPFISLLSSPGTTPSSNNPGAATAYTQNANNGQISPETAFGYDLGFDQRLPHATALSLDLYSTTLHNLFLPSTFLNGTYTPTSGLDAGHTAPLFVSQTQNLGQARYQGVELAVQRTPAVGLGFRLQGTLERAYTYNLPPGFYDTAAGPFTTNLGVLPNVNFQTSGTGFNALATARIPYASGYAEANYRTRAGTYYELGWTYYGSNNSFNQPAFGVISATGRFALAKNTALQVSANNLLGAYNGPVYGAFSGIPVPLASGAANMAPTGAFGLTSGVNVGPSTVRILLRHSFGGQ